MQHILDFPKQFAFEANVENKEKLHKHHKFLVAGMGGSNLQTLLMRDWRPSVDIMVHRDYGLPDLDDKRLVIACSYSGNTEEVIDSYKTAQERQLPLAVITSGGKLLELAKKDGVPHVVIPNTGIQPRAAVGFMFVALLRLMGDAPDLKDVHHLVETLKSDALKSEGERLASQLVDHVPVIYASTRNKSLAYLWKIRFNENTKLPAYTGVFPELNHNEMNGYDGKAQTKDMAKQFRFLFLRDEEDHARILRRMDITKKLYADRGLGVEEIKLSGATRLERMFNAILIADWVTVTLAKTYGVDPEPVPMVEEFKKLMV